jgi:hypothetical protein
MTVKVKLLAYSEFNGETAATIELTYPRFIHAEVMTHRVFSRNSASSRAIPAKKMRQAVLKDIAMPIHWGANQAGMQAYEEISAKRKKLGVFLWKTAAKLACGMHYLMEKAGIHKQVTNRIIEPFMHMRVVVTSTDWESFLWLRDHKAAQPEIQLLAKKIRNVLSYNNPRKLKEGDVHLPYVTKKELRKYVSLDSLLALSSARCAAVSYNTYSDNIDLNKAKQIKAKLMASKDDPEDRFHASPFEHQLFAVSDPEHPGWTHIDRHGRYYSGNVCGFVQYRHILEQDR